MYERMLDKQCEPSFEEFVAYCGECEELFKQLDKYLMNEIGAERLLRFPYGNSYGWGQKYFIKRNNICDVFAEKEAFTVMLRLSNAQFEKAYFKLSDYTKEYIDHKYPCGEGGWIHYRVLKEQDLKDIQLLLKMKVQKRGEE